ncbi:MAG: hypothetical protein HN411_01525 [Waddliaceae bacterium]|jgi:hypothetical protein|nr:hypothetical protein [Waddliaceae bacterium]MBT3578470.1 hypothetical protein [Waddliaceae bacterium]MBT4444950.1 hypothetical protein [Waddliaceae bacterium]MBT6927994.1 hypothetical protein [Waddliaceae bacterium]MBT7263890.1 hypothetical protein [Waddliaceae bacterium]
MKVTGTVRDSSRQGTFPETREISASERQQYRDSVVVLNRKIMSAEYIQEIIREKGLFCGSKQKPSRLSSLFLTRKRYRSFKKQVRLQYLSQEIEAPGVLGVYTVPDFVDVANKILSKQPDYYIPSTFDLLMSKILSVSMALDLDSLSGIEEDFADVAIKLAKHGQARTAAGNLSMFYALIDMSVAKKSSGSFRFSFDDRNRAARAAISLVDSKLSYPEGDRLFVILFGTVKKIADEDSFDDETRRLAREKLDDKELWKKCEEDYLKFLLDLRSVELSV